MCPGRLSENPLNTDTRKIPTLRRVPLVSVLTGSTVLKYRNTPALGSNFPEKKNENADTSACNLSHA